MRQALNWRAPTGVAGVLGTGDGLVDSRPGQHQSELEPQVTRADVGVARTDRQFQVGQSQHRIARFVQEAAWHSDDVAGKHQIYDLSLAIAQQLIARGKATLDKAQLAVFVAVYHEVSALVDHELGLEQLPQARQIIVAQVEIALQPHNEGVPPRLTGNDAETMHLMRPAKASFNPKH